MNSTVENEKTNTAREDLHSNSGGNINAAIPPSAEGNIRAATRTDSGGDIKDTMHPDFDGDIVDTTRTNSGEVIKNSMHEKIENGVAAIVITYNGDDALFDNLNALFAQCEKVIIVDNDSAADMGAVFSFARKAGAEIIQNSKNLGVATALNIGVRRAIELGFEYYLTMDQDSILQGGCVEEMLAVMKSDTRLGSVFPNLRKIGKRRRRSTRFLAACRCITSGNLVKSEVFEKTGGYEDALFIDSIDFDFNFRTRLAGYRMAKVNNAFMQQKFGTPTVGRFGKKIPRTPSIFRYYYIARNHRYEWRTYFPKFPLSIAFLYFYAHWDLWRILLFSHDSKAIRREIRRGKKDYRRLLSQIKQNRQPPSAPQE